MDPPLWYQVAQRKLSFREFEERFNDSLFHEEETLPILVLSALYNHDPYVSDIHVLQKMITGPRMSDRALRAIYLYWVLGKPFRSDSVLNGNGLGGTFQGIRIALPNDFDDDYLYNWLSIILRCFFVLGPLHRSDGSYQPGNLTHLKKGLAYIEEASSNSFEITSKTMGKAYRLSIAHDMLKEVRGFFLGKSFPQVIRPYRKSRRFVESAVALYWPTILKGLEIEAPFEDWEIEVIRQAHEKLHLSGDLEFYFYYTEKIEQIFGKDHPITISLKTKVEPTPENEARQIKSHLGRLDPYERKKFFLQKLMVSDRQLNEFIESVKSSSFEKAIRPYLLANKKRIDEEISLTGGQIANTETLATQTSIYFYSPDDLIFYSDQQKVYIFLKEELEQFRDKQNPYDRQPLPEKLFEQAKTKTTVDSIDELWQRILRRRVEFSDL
jgi:hypothetical protein